MVFQSTHTHVKETYVIFAAELSVDLDDIAYRVAIEDIAAIENNWVVSIGFSFFDDQVQARDQLYVAENDH